MSGVNYSHPSVSKNDLFALENYSSVVATNIVNAAISGISTVESGAAFRCLTGSSAETTAVTSADTFKLPLFTTGTFETTYSRDFTAVTAAGADQNSIRYTGSTSKRFCVRIGVLFTTASSSCILYVGIPLPSSASFVANGILTAQNQLPAPTSGGMYINFEFLVTLAQNQKIEFYVKTNAGASGSITNSTGVTFNSVNQVVPGVTIVIDEARV